MRKDSNGECSFTPVKLGSESSELTGKDQVSTQ